MKRKGMKFFTIFVLILAVLCLFTGCDGTSSTQSAMEVSGSGEATTTTTTNDATAVVATSSNRKPIRITIDEWVGYEGLVDANGGLITAPDSENAKRGLYIEYLVVNEHDDSSNALISGEAVGCGYTVNRFAFLHSKFKEAGVDVVMPFITNYSNGADGIIARSDILSVRDLVGKKIAVPQFTEAQTLVEWLLNTSDLSEAEKSQIRGDMVFCESPYDTAMAYFSGTVDAAATWEPFLTQAESSTDSRILFDTSMSKNLILSGIIFRQDFLDNNEDFMTKFIDAAFAARPMYKHVFDNIRQMPSFEVMTDQEIVEMAEGADLTSWADNNQLLNNEAVIMYEEMAKVWQGLGVDADPARSKTAFTDKYIQNLRSKYENEETTEESFDTSDKMQIIESPDSLLTYNADIKFALNSCEIRQESYAELDEFVKVAKILDGVYIQIEGNASKRAEGVSENQIIAFSEERATSIANYFISKGISKDRIIVVGNGDLKPLNQENTAAAENRRTDIFFKTKMGY